MINKNHLIQLQLVAGSDKAKAQEFYSLLVKAFEDSVPAGVAKLRKQLLQKEYRDLRRTAHSLKSSFGNLGMESMQKIAQQIEYAPETITHDEFHQLISRIESSFQGDFASAKSFIYSL